MSFKLQVVKRIIKSTVTLIKKKSRDRFYVDLKVLFIYNWVKELLELLDTHCVLTYIDLETDSSLISALQISWSRFLNSSVTYISRCIFYTSASHFFPSISPFSM